MRDAGKIAGRLRQSLPQCIVVIQPEAGHVLLDTQAQVLPFLALAADETHDHLSR